MVNKKKEALITVGTVVGTVAGMAAVIAGAYAVYNYLFEKKVQKDCNECLLEGTCVCHGKYVKNCGERCLCDEIPNMEEEDFKNA